MARLIAKTGLGEPSDWLFVNEAGNQIAENKTLQRLKACALEAKVLVEPHPQGGKAWSLVKWHCLRQRDRARACVSRIRREVWKVAMRHAANPIQEH